MLWAASLFFIPSSILFKKNDLNGGVLMFRLMPGAGMSTTEFGNTSALASQKSSLARLRGLISLLSVDFSAGAGCGCEVVAWCVSCNCAVAPLPAAAKPMLAAALKLPCFSRSSIIERIVRYRSEEHTSELQS